MSRRLRDTRSVWKEKGLLAAGEDDGKALLAFVGDILPVAGLDLVGREKFAAHTYAEDTRSKPFLQIILVRRNATGDHDLGPRHRSQDALNQVRVGCIARENLR